MEKDRLKKQAREYARFRGHKMSNFRWNIRLYESTCKVCGAMMWVIPNPAPNETTICGSAIAVNCNPEYK